tara:strand:- start:265 stop:1128 length:864 start_codon:yes stop_codon:yes gene_type:complete
MDYSSFEEFESVLYKLALDDKYPTKEQAPLMSPAVYEPNTKRANDNVTGWANWCALDIDNFKGTMEEIEESYSKYKYICYSTASSTKENPKFRLVFPLTQFLEKDDIKHFWFALNKEIGDIADAQTKDLSRMYYIPNTYNGAYNFIFSHEGEIMDPARIMELHPYINKHEGFFTRLPEAIQRGLIEHRKGRLTNTNYTWTGYDDCPFVNKTQIEEYKSITDTGWYAKLYQIMVSTAGNAMSKGYPITAKEIEYLCRQLDQDTGNWYLKRDIEKEAERAIEFVFKNNI